MVSHPVAKQRIGRGRTEIDGHCPQDPTEDYMPWTSPAVWPPPSSDGNAAGAVGLRRNLSASRCWNHHQHQVSSRLPRAPIWFAVSERKHEDGFKGRATSERAADQRMDVPDRGVVLSVRLMVAVHAVL